MTNAEAQRRFRKAHPELIAERQRRYKEDNREKVAEAQRRYKEDNRNKVTEKQRRYKEANRDRILEQRGQYREANREQIAKQRRSHREANREQEAERMRRWREANPELVVEMSHRRRARKLAATIGVVTGAGLAAKWAYWSGRCWMCGAEADTWDHVIPLVLGGPHCLSNLRPACRSCNSRKGARRHNPEEANNAEAG